MDGPIEFGSFTGMEIQNIIAFLSHCEGKGVTDVRFIRQQASEYMRRNVERMTMTPEQRTEALQRKRIMRQPETKKLIAAANAIGPCPHCEGGSLVEVRREGVIYLACKKHGRYGCGYSTQVGEY